MVANFILGQINGIFPHSPCFRVYAYAHSIHALSLRRNGPFRFSFTLLDEISTHFPLMVVKSVYQIEEIPDGVFLVGMKF